MKSSTPIERKGQQIRVIKVGGSLFDFPDLKKRLVEWSEMIADAHSLNVWICGGGGFVDEVRNWQSLHGLDDKRAHRISVRLMSQTARLFQSLSGDWPLIEDIREVKSVEVDSTHNVVFDCRQWALSDKDLENSWDVTSDTISLRLAEALSAKHLFLLKSRSLNSNRVADMTEAGLIDQKFSSELREGSLLKASIVNLRESNNSIDLVW